ncbi:MAG: WG repeat-containing protein [Dysgonomonas sp.]|nr:WG repeat-containing protein [Dysgonomonas sp.]
MMDMRSIFTILLLSFILLPSLCAQQVCGLYTNEGKKLLPISFEELIIADNYIFASKKGRLQVYKYNGKKIRRMPYTNIMAFFANTPDSVDLKKYDNICLFDYKKQANPLKESTGKASQRLVFVAINDNKYGFIDTLGNEITPVKYDKVYHEREKLFIVQSKGKWGLVNLDAPQPEIVPCKYVYKSAKDIIIQGDYISMKNDKLKGAVYDIYGNVILPEGVWLKPLQEGYWAVCHPSTYAEWGVVNSRNERITPRRYHRIDYIPSNGLWEMRNGETSIFVDTLGNTVKPEEVAARNREDSINTPPSLFSKEGSRWYINRIVNGEIQKTETAYRDINRSYEDDSGVCFASNHNFQWHILDTNGQIIKRISYIAISYINNCFIVQEKGRYGVIDKKGKILIPIKYSKIEAYGNYFVVTRNKSAGRISAMPRFFR